MCISPNESTRMASVSLSMPGNVGTSYSGSSPLNAQTRPSDSAVGKRNSAESSGIRSETGMFVHFPSAPNCQ